jgi:hypothetical protein
VGFPDAIRVADPGAGPARWLGVWEGRWRGGSDTRLVVERVEPASAVVVYAWAADPGGAFPAGWNRLIADLSPEQALAWGGSDARFSFNMAASGDGANGSITTQQGTGMVELHRCTAEGVARVADAGGAPSAEGQVLQDALSGPGALQPTECPTGRSSGTFREGGYVLRAAGRCQENQPVVFASTGPVNDLTVPDGEIRFQVRTLAGSDRLRLRIAVRADPATGGSRGYLLRLDPGRGVADLVAATSDQGALLDVRTDLKQRLASTDWATVTLRMRGPDLWVLLNDEPLLSGRDAAFTTGSLYITALRLGDAGDDVELAVALRNLTVSQLAGSAVARQPVYSGPAGGAPATASAPANASSATATTTITESSTSSMGCRTAMPAVFEASGDIKPVMGSC